MILIRINQKPEAKDTTDRRRCSRFQNMLKDTKGVIKSHKSKKDGQ
jgi:hypothetical protein